jgi:hypothetical protein
MDRYKVQAYDSLVDAERDLNSGDWTLVGSGSLGPCFVAVLERIQVTYELVDRNLEPMDDAPTVEFRTVMRRRTDANGVVAAGVPCDIQQGTWLDETLDIMTPAVTVHHRDGSSVTYSRRRGD